MVSVMSARKHRGCGGVKLQEKASRVYSMTLPNYEVVLIQMDLGYASDGLYYAKIPFGPNATVPDAGAGDAAVDAM